MDCVLCFYQVSVTGVEGKMDENRPSLVLVVCHCGAGDGCRFRSAGKSGSGKAGKAMSGGYTRKECETQARI